MRKFLRKMLLMALMIVPLVAMSQEVVYSCDFENEEDATAWEYANGTQTNKWCIDTATHHGTGTKSLYVSNDGGLHHAYSINSPSCVYAYETITFTRGAYSYSYDWKCGGEGSYDYMRVAVVPSSTIFTGGSVHSGLSRTGMPNDWIVLDGGVGLNGENSWVTATGDFYIPSDGDYKLVYYWYNDFNGGTGIPPAIDNITISVPQCPAPVLLTATNVLNDEATLSWIETGGASSWMVEYGPANATNSGYVTETVNDTVIYLSGLEYNTIYNVRVVAICGSDYSDTLYGSFRSACGPITLPYSCTFDDTPSGEFPACWYNINESNVKSNTKEGSQTLKFAAGGMIATPYVPLEGNLISLRFNLKREGTQSGDMQIGFVTDLANLDEMMVVRTISPSNNNFIEYEFDFASLGDEVVDEGYIIFKQTNNTSDNWFYWLDDVYIRQISDCQRPASMMATRVKHSSATLVWTPIEGATYEVAYGTATEPDALEGITTVSDITDDTLAITDLESETEYYIWVRNDCGGEYSDWRAGGSFTTQEACARLASVEIMSTTTRGAALSWTYNTAIGKPATAVEVSYRERGSNDAYVTTVTMDNYYMFDNLESATPYEFRLRTICDSDSADALTGVFITKPCGLTIGGGTATTSDFPTNIYDEYSYTQMLYPASSLTGLDSIKGISFNYVQGGGFVREVDVYIGMVNRGEISTSNYVRMDSLTCVATDASLIIDEGWCAIHFDTTLVYDGSSNIVVVVYDHTGTWNSSRSVYYHQGGKSLHKSSYYSMNITSSITGLESMSGTPDIIFNSNCSESCAAPLVTVSEVSATEIGVVWLAGGLDNQWVVEYKLESETEWTEFENTASTSAMIDNLQPGSFYEVRVGSLCGVDTLYAKVSAFTECAAVAVPYSENFNANIMNPCISLGNLASTSGAPYLSSSALYFGYTEEGYAVLPEIIDDLNTLRISFDMKAYNASAQVVVAVGSDKNDWTTFIPIDTVQLTTSNTYEPQMVYFNHYEGAGHYVALMALSTSIYVDNVVIESTPLCAMPMNMAISQITVDAAELTWNGDNGLSDQWLIEWRNLTTNETFEETTVETMFALSNLAADTEYEVLVSNLCGSDTIRALRSISFRTDCGEMVIPFIESFETKPTMEFPSCWTSISGYSRVISGSSYTTAGTHVLELDNSAVVASPRVPISGSSIAVDFLLKRSSADAGKIVVGFSTSLTDLSGMEIVDTIAPTNNNCLSYELDFSNIESAEEGYIIWKQIDIYSGYDAYSTEYYLDNIYIREISDCGRPESVSVSGIRNDKAFLRWTAVEGATEYEVMYGTANDVNSPLNISQIVTTDTTTIYGLEGNTTYYAWVRNSCNGSYSDWRETGEFTTQVDCAELINVEVVSTSVSGISLAWNFNNSVGAPATGVQLKWKADSDENYTTVYTDETYYMLNGLESGVGYEIQLRTICSDDTAAAYVVRAATNDCGVIVDYNSTISNMDIPASVAWKYSYAQMLYPATDLVDMDTIKSFSFYWNSDLQTTRTWDIYLANVNQATLTPTTYIPVDSMTLVASNVQFSLSRGWCMATLTTPFAYDGTSNLVIAIDDNTGSFPSGTKSFLVHDGSSLYIHSDSQNSDPSSPSSFSSTARVPNIKFAKPCPADMCVAPLLALHEITNNSATLVWARNSADQSWKVDYKLTSDEDWTTANASVADTFITLNNLQPGSFYQFRVGTICGEETQYATIEGFTNCADVTAPLVENFNGEILNPCWTYGNLQPNNDIPYLSSRSLYLSYDADGYAISPKFTNDLSSLHALFSIKSFNETSQLVIALGSDPTDFSSFVPIDTFMVSATSVFEPQECSFESYTGQGHYVAFYSPTGKMYVDDVTIEPLPACSFPSNLAISNVTDVSATITWTGDNALSSGWLIDYHVIGDNNVIRQQVASTEYSYTMTGLLSNTQYEVMVRNVCSEDTVAALIPITFRTECGALTLPYFENFETINIGTYHPCWFTSGIHTYGDYYFEESAPEIVNVSEYGHALKFGDNVDMTSQRIPAPLNSLKITFDAKAENMSYTGDLVVGYVTNPASTVITAIDTIEFANSSWNTYEYSLTNLTVTDTGYIVFKNINNDPLYDYYYDEMTYYNGYIDNVLFMIDNGCEEVSNVSVSNVTQTSVDVSFSDASASGSYTIGYSTTNNSNTISDTVTITDTTYTLTGLQSGTKYFIWVRNNCTAGGSPWTAGPSFNTPCSVLSELPYSENFDGYTYGVSTSTSAPSGYPTHEMPNCWNFVNMSSSTSQYPQAFMSSSTYYAFDGNCLFMKSSKTNPLYAILPEFTTHVSALQISFKYRNEGVSGSNGTLAVGVMSDISDPSTFTMVKEYPQSQTIVTGEHNFAVDGLDASINYVIAFRYSGGSSDNFYFAIDDVVVDSASGCPTPESLALSSVTENTASFTWNGASSSYNVQYRLASATDWTDAPSVTTNAITLTGLTSQTNYSIRVQSVCGAEVSEWSGVLNFSTMCGACAIPYSENFDSYTQDIATGTSSPDNYPNHAMPSCWTFPVLNGPKVFLSHNSYYATTGNCLFMVSNSSEYAYAVLPTMSVDVDSLWINFNYIHESTSINNSPLSIGVMTNPNDPTTFRELETYPIVSTVTAAEHSFSTDTGFVDGVTYYIAFRYGQVANLYYLGIDDIVVDYAPTCVKPASLTVNNVMSNTADLTWLGTASNYEVSYKAESDAVWTSITSASSTITLTNLTAATPYQARVRALCSATDTSDWSNTVSFTTECAVYTLPFSENFNHLTSSFDDLLCWERYKGLLSDIQAGTDDLVLVTNGWSCFNSATYPVNNGGANVYLDIYGINVKSWLVSPSIAITAGAELTFDLARRDYNNSTIFDDDDKFIVLATSDNGTTWTELQTWNGASYSSIPLYTDTADAITISLSQYAGQTVKIAFYGESTVSGGDHYVHIDNVNIDTDIPTCGVPTNLVATNVTATSATLSWNGTATSYDVEYRTENATNWTSANITETSYGITALQPLTNYVWRVRGNCGDVIGNSEWAEGRFATLDMPCATPTNVTVEVEGNTAIIDWQADEGQSSWEVMVYALDTISQVVASHPATISNLYGGTNYTVKVRAICAENLYSDWSETTTFTTTQCATVSNVAVSDITESTAVVTWRAGGNESAWQINYGHNGFGQDEGEMVEVNATTYTLDGLDENTTYDVYVRALCGDAFYSLWSDKVQFSTLEHQEGIDGVESDIHFTIYPNPTSGATTISLQGVEGKITISVVDMNGRTITTEAIDCGSDCEKRIDVAGLAQGTYFVRVLGDNLNSVRKLIVR